MTFVFYVSRPNFLKINAGARKKQTNHQKINTVLHSRNAKCDGLETFVRGTIDDTIDEKQLISAGHRLVMQRKKQTNKGRPLEQISSAALSNCSPSLSRPVSVHSSTCSERTCAREWLIDGRTSSSFFSVKVNVLPTKAITHKKNFFRDFSSETFPWIQ